MALTSPYVFPGIYPFIQKAVGDHPHADLVHIGRVNESWFLKQIQSALGQLWRQEAVTGRRIQQDRKSQLAILDVIRGYRECLAASLEGVDAAILEVTSELDLPIPTYLPTNSGPYKPADFIRNLERAPLVVDGERDLPLPKMRKRTT